MYSKSKTNKCKYCGQFFFLKSCLVSHELKHKGEERQNQSTDVDKGKEANAIEAENTKPKENEAENVSKEVNTINCDENVIEGRKPFSCHICGKQYNLKNLFEIHLISHRLPEIQFSVVIDNSLETGKQDIKTYFSCSFCQKEYIHRKACAQHIRRNHKGSKLGHSGEIKTRNIKEANSDDKEKFISKGSKSKPDESYNSRNHEIKACFSCCFCEKDFTNREACTQHIRQNHKASELGLSRKINNRIIKIVNSDDKAMITEVSKSKLVSLDKNCDSRRETEACFSCPFCQKEYTNKKSYNQHMRQNHDPSRLGQSVKTKTRIIKEAKTSNTEKANSDDKAKVSLIDSKSKPLSVSSYLCTICDEKFPSKTVLSEHCEKHKEDLICVKCQKKCCNIKALRDHVSRVHSVKTNVLCELCGKSVGKKTYPLHLRVHSGVKPFQCKKCDKCFTQRCHLVTHMKYHNRVREHSCKVCNKLFITKNEVYYHMKVHDRKDDDDQYKCRTCNEKFTKWQSLSKHEREAHPGKHFVCHICDIRFTYSSFLYEHYLTQHSEDDIEKLDSEVKELLYKKKRASVKCEYCDRYIYKYQLKTHMKLHTGEKPFKCNHCEKNFRLKYALQIHERSHTGERPYHCNLCNKTFTQLHHLKSHIVLHTGEKHYKCKFCNKAFAVQSYLYNHEKIHTRDSDAPARVKKAYECSHCGNKFKRKCDCMDHESSCQFIPGGTSSDDISGKNYDNESMRTSEHSDNTIDHRSIDGVPSDQFEPQVILSLE